MQYDFGEAYIFSEPMWLELSFVGIFVFGFALLRFKTIGRRGSPHRHQYDDEAKRGKSVDSLKTKKVKVFQTAHAEASVGNAAAAISAWQLVQSTHLTPIDTLKHVVQAFLVSDAAGLVDNLVQHLDLHASDAAAPKAALAALEVVANDGNESIMEKLYEACVSRLKINPSLRMQEAYLIRALSLMMKGYLKNRNVDAAAAQIKKMSSENISVPSTAVVALLRVARQFNRALDVFDSLDKATLMTSNTVASVLDDCLLANDALLAKRVEHFARDAKVQLNCCAYGALLKICTSAGDSHAIQLFEETQQTFPVINEGLVIGLLARCAERKFLRFAEYLTAFMRSQNKMSLMVYSALMKVYSYCRMYNKACDLYDELIVEGFEPDDIMYGCLIKYSAECGRTDLTKELSAKIPNKKLNAQHYMSLIRAAGQKKDVDEALVVLQQFRGAGGLDSAICNAVLDVCVSNGDMDRARGLLHDMEANELADCISYNTLVKGYCMIADADKAFEVVSDMENAGLKPNEITYNCLINLAAIAGDFKSAWKTAQTMESAGLQIDHYTVASLLKALKRAPSGKGDLQRVLDLIDRSRINVFCEEVLLNAALDACMKHGEHHRLENLLDSMRIREPTELAAYTYASLIKACNTLKNVPRCWEFWMEMTELRGVEPTDIALGCMLDALVCNGFVHESVALFRKWERRVPVNTVMYSTLIKGFNNVGDTTCAIELWNELRSKKVPTNAKVYNVVIDVHARVGATQEVTRLVEEMEADGISPDGFTKSIVAKAYCVSGEIEQAIDIFRSWPADSNNVVIYNTILDGCVSHQRIELFDELVAQMDEYRVAPSTFTLGIVVKMWGRRRNLQEAFAVVRYWSEKYGFVVNGSVKTSLFFACLHNDAISQALDVFEQLRAAKYRVDAKMFSALIKNCVRVGQVDKAMKLMDDAYGLSSGKRELAFGEQLEDVCVERVMNCLWKHGKFPRVGAPLIQKMIEANIPMSNEIMSYYWQGQDWSWHYDGSQDMQHHGW